jgi:y4mF family transcriptional regulator
MFPIGNMANQTVRTSAQLGELIRQRRKALDLRQADLALAAGTGRRFIIDLESGKQTTRLDALFRVLAALGVGIKLVEVGGFGESDAPRE